MLAYVLCQLGHYNSTKPTFLVPKLYQYMSNFEVKASTGGVDGSWCIVIVDDSTQIPLAAQQDPNILILSTTAQLDTVLSTPQRNQVNTQLALTPWAIAGTPVRAVSGDTSRIVLDKIRQAVGDSPESWGLGL